jgi:hypothetical protein
MQLPMVAANDFGEMATQLLTAERSHVRYTEGEGPARFYLQTWLNHSLSRSVAQ